VRSSGCKPFSHLPGVFPDAGEFLGVVDAADEDFHARRLEKRKSP